MKKELFPVYEKNTLTGKKNTQQTLMNDAETSISMQVLLSSFTRNTCMQQPLAYIFQTLL